jgi:hypothetical protein
MGGVVLLSAVSLIVRAWGAAGNSRGCRADACAGRGSLHAGRGRRDLVAAFGLTFALGIALSLLVQTLARRLRGRRHRPIPRESPEPGRSGARPLGQEIFRPSR